MKTLLFSLLFGCLVVGGPVVAGEFAEEWADDSPGADGSQLEAWQLGNGEASKISLTMIDGKPGLTIGAETFAHLRTKSAFPVREKILVSSRIRLNPELAKTGAGFGVRSEKLGQPEGYEVRINPTLKKIFVFRVSPDGEKQLMERPFPSGSEAHDVSLLVDRSGSALKLTLSSDKEEMGVASDPSPVELGANVRPYLTSRGGTEIRFEKIELTEP